MGWWGDNSYDCDHVEDSYLSLKRYIKRKTNGEFDQSQNNSDIIKRNNILVSEFIRKQYEKMLESDNDNQSITLCEIIVGLTIKIFDILGYYNTHTSDVDYMIDIEPALICSELLYNNIENERDNFLREKYFIKRKKCLENEINFLKKLKYN